MSAMNNSWTKQVWTEALPVYNDIIDHPFIKELASGSLPVECFDRYLAQDELYVGNYGRQMFELADLITDPEQHAMFEASPARASMAKRLCTSCLSNASA